MRKMYILKYSAIKYKIVKEHEEESDYEVQYMLYTSRNDYGYEIIDLSREQCLKKLLELLENKVKEEEKELNKCKKAYEKVKKSLEE